MSFTLKRLPVMMAAMIAGLSGFVGAQSPALGWFKAGTAPMDYETGVDTQVSMSGSASGSLRSLVARPSGFGSLVHEVSAADYQGKRIRLSSYVKTQDVTDWAVLWMRIDAGRRVLTIDTMMNRPIKGHDRLDPIRCRTRRRSSRDTCRFRSDAIWKR